MLKLKGQYRHNARESRLRRDVNKLKRLLANKTVEVDFFRSALQKDEARRQQRDICGAKVSRTQFEMPLQGNLSIERMCQLTQVSRAGFYRYLQGRTPAEEDMTMRSAIQEIALEHDGYYGYRRVAAELRRRGMMVNHKRVARIMTTDNLLTIQNRKLRQVTDRDQELEIYLNLELADTNFSACSSRGCIRLQADVIVNRIAKTLLAAQVSLRRLNCSSW